MLFFPFEGNCRSNSHLLDYRPTPPVVLIDFGLAGRGRTSCEQLEISGDTCRCARTFLRLRRYSRLTRFGFPSSLCHIDESARGEIDAPAPIAPGHEPSEEHVEGLTAQPFWDTSERHDLFPWAAQLEANADIVLKEFEEKLSGADAFASDSAWQNQVMGSGWSAVRLQRLGVWNSENCAAFPRTYELLKSLKIPLAVRGVCFARQAPDTGVQPHSDGRNFILTSHLGLKVPDGCWIEVGGERRGWEVGKLTTIDTSFIHSTGNPSSDEDRHVLILDFWHPELTEAERAALEFVYDLRNRFESGQVPIRKPRSLRNKGGGGLAGMWQSLTGGG